MNFPRMTPLDKRAPCTEDMIKRTIPVDTKGDFKVGHQDLVLWANAYGSHPGHTKWNPNAEIGETTSPAPHTSLSWLYTMNNAILSAHT